MAEFHGEEFRRDKKFKRRGQVVKEKLEAIKRHLDAHPNTPVPRTIYFGIEQYTECRGKDLTKCKGLGCNAWYYIEYGHPTLCYTCRTGAGIPLKPEDKIVRPPIDWDRIRAQMAERGELPDTSHCRFIPG